MKKSFLVLMALLLAVGLIITACGKPEAGKETPTSETPTSETPTIEKETYNFKWSGMNPEGAVDSEYMLAMFDKILERSDGRIQIEFYPASQLGDWVTIGQEVLVGSIDMGQTCALLNDTRTFGSHGTMFCTRDHDKIKRLFSRGGTIYELMAPVFEENGAKMLGLLTYTGLPGACFTKSPPSPGDPDVPKEMTVRASPGKSSQAFVNALGYNAVQLPWNEIFVAMQTGVIDGAVGGTPALHYDSFRDVTKTYVDYEYGLSNYQLIMNLELFNTLSEEDQQIILDSVTEVCNEAFGLSEALHEKALQAWTDYGVEVIRLTDEEWEKCAEVVIREVSAYEEETYGSTYNAVKAALLAP